MLSVMIAVIGFIAATILFSALQVRIKLIFCNGDNFSYVQFRALGNLYRVRFNLSFGKDGDNPFGLTKEEIKTSNRVSNEEVIHTIHKALSFYSYNRDHIKFLSSKAIIRNLTVKASIGTKDAAWTALVSVFVLNILMYINRHLKCKNNSIEQNTEVIPVFEGDCFKLDVDCIISIRLGYIILMMLKIGIGRMKGGEKYAPASN